MWPSNLYSPSLSNLDCIPVVEIFFNTFLYEINKIVYKLYGLTENEIAIVENS